MKPIKVKENSKFNTLKLPKKYKRITTTRRLVQEGTWQKHCVTTYDEEINKDKCAIYSLLEDGNRYTIEIRKHRNKFICR